MRVLVRVCVRVWIGEWVPVCACVVGHISVWVPVFVCGSLCVVRVCICAVVDSCVGACECPCVCG